MGQSRILLTCFSFGWGMAERAGLSNGAELNTLCPTADSGEGEGSCQLSYSQTVRQSRGDISELLGHIKKISLNISQFYL